VTNEEIAVLRSDLETQNSFAVTRRKLTLNWLGSEELPITFEPSVLSPDQVAGIIEQLVSQPAETREKVAAALYNLCQSSFQVCSVDFQTPQHQLDWEAESTGTFDRPKVPTSIDEIWPLVRFIKVVVSKDPFSDMAYASLNGECAWDGEHGAAVRFDDGQRLTKTGGWNDW